MHVYHRMRVYQAHRMHVYQAHRMRVYQAHRMRVYQAELSPCHHNALFLVGDGHRLSIRCLHQSQRGRD